MGSYLNPGNEKFKEALNSPIYGKRQIKQCIEK